MIGRLSLAALVLSGLSACGPSYSPDTYATNAVQQANKVEQGVIVGVRNVDVSAAGAVGTVTGAAAGGIAGSQAVVGPISAFTALGGALVGGIAGSAVEHTVADTTAFEYIVRKTKGDLVSVTQKDKTPLTLGEKVLVIAGNQARVVPDYTVPPATAAETKAAETPPADVKAAQAKSINLAPIGGSADDAKSPDAQPVIVPSTAGTSPEVAKPGDTQPTGTPPVAPAAAPATLPSSANTIAAGAIPTVAKQADPPAH